MDSTGDLVPNFEVKALLDPSKVLDSDGKLNDAVKTAFNVKKSTKKMNIQFVDTVNQDIYTSGWNLRIRNTDDEPGCELTYKKRYGMGDAFQVLTAAENSISGVVKTAATDGFDSSTPFEAQVEVGQQGQTLSLSCNVEVDGKDLPGKKDSRKVLAKKAPQKFKDWSAQQSADFLADAIIYGPVHAKRYTGSWNGHKVAIEVWPIRKSKTDSTLEPIVEVSFKTDDTSKAVEDRVGLAKFAQDSGWFLPTDSLKTKLIMERYG